MRCPNARVQTADTLAARMIHYGAPHDKLRIVIDQNKFVRS